FSLGEFPEPYLRFVCLFNSGAFFESHEVLESLWLHNRDRFYQGLIVLAAAFVHIERGRPRGAAKALAKAGAFLAPYAPWYRGMDVARLLRDIAGCQRTLAESGGDVAAVPRIVLPFAARNGL
ncbi:MAG: DUF309 domain-containing protein, partial [Clostridia bacterium]|nr:DUF309 domain-containing protein [Clostridia bacterium]